jgi:5-methyltetrahydrofolate--homocysteine methyltransferase
MAAMVRDYGPNVVGGCCGTTPDHIRALVAALRDVTPHAHEVTAEPRIASAMRGVDLGQEPRPTIVGERVNTQGSRKIKEMILADDFDGALAVAR